MAAGGKAMVLMRIIEALRERGDREVLLALAGEQLRTVSGAELQRAVIALATRLHACGVASSDTIALLAPASPHWVAAYLATIHAGALAVPLDYDFDDATVARLAVAAGCRLCITTRGRAERLRAAAADWRPQYLDIDDTLPPAYAPGEAAATADEAGAAPRPDAPASLLLTSGTTGPPKMVPLTHGQLDHNVGALTAAGLVRTGDRVLLPLPLHHVYPFTAGLLTTLASGGVLIFPGGLSGPQIIEAMQKATPDAMVGVPRLYESLVAGIVARAAARGRLAGFAFNTLLRLSMAVRSAIGLRIGRLLFPALHRFTGSRLRLMGCGGARLDDATWLRLEGMGWEVLTGYGLSETAPVVTFNPRGRGRMGTAGVALPGVAIRIAARAGGDDGEIQVRGPNVFSGYRGDPERSRAAFTTDGWFRTGDLGTLDADGYLRVVGRADELIVLADGKKFFPEEVERVYGENPFIREIALLPAAGRLMALVVPDLEAIRARGTARITTLLHEEIELMGARLPRYQRVSGVTIVTQPLPRTRLGKLRRHLLPGILATAQQAASPAGAAAADNSPPPGLTPLQQRLWQRLADRFPGWSLRMDSSLQLDLGVDSLEWINLTLDWQQALGIRLTEETLTGIITVGDLMGVVADGSRAAGGEAPAPVAPAAQLRPRGPLLALAARVFHAFTRVMMRSFYRIHAIGLEHLPAAGPVLLTPNHCSYLDAPALVAVLPWSVVERTWWAGWARLLFTGPVTRAFSRLVQAIPIDPDRSPAAGLALAREVLAAPRVLVWFPEGRRSPTGELLPLEPGIGALIAAGREPVVPVHIAGTFAALPRTRRWPRPGRVVVRFGEVCDASILAAEGEGTTTAERITRALHARMARLAAMSTVDGEGAGSAGTEPGGPGA